MVKSIKVESLNNISYIVIVKVTRLYHEFMTVKYFPILQANFKQRTPHKKISYLLSSQPTKFYFVQFKWVSKVYGIDLRSRISQICVTLHPHSHLVTEGYKHIH